MFASRAASTCNSVEQASHRITEWCELQDMNGKQVDEAAAVWLGLCRICSSWRNMTFV